jgi:hypothetical protein
MGIKPTRDVQECSTIYILAIFLEACWTDQNADMLMVDFDEWQQMLLVLLRGLKKYSVIKMSMSSQTFTNQLSQQTNFLIYTHMLSMSWLLFCQ